MANALATAIVSAGGDAPWPVCIIPSRAQCVQRGSRPCSFTAPGWRPMAFLDLDAARAKLARHPGFIRWDR